MGFGWRILVEVFGMVLKSIIAVLILLLIPFSTFAIEIGTQYIETSTTDTNGKKRLIPGQIYYPIVEGSGDIADSFELVKVWQKSENTIKLNALIKPGKYPLVIFSHGTQGDRFHSSWIAEFLAKHNFITIAIDHLGDTNYDRNPSFNYTYVWQRTLDMSFMLDYLLQDPKWQTIIDSNRIVASGFSMGGATALWLAGIKGDPQKFCTFFENDLHTTLKISFENFGKDYRDNRIKAAIAFAPSFGECCFTKQSLKKVEIPVLIIIGAKDNIAPGARFYAKYIPNAKLKVIEGAEHFSFLNSCSDYGREVLSKEICAGPDRNKIHQEAEQAVLEFLNENLK